MKKLGDAQAEAYRVLAKAGSTFEEQAKVLRYLKKTAIQFFWRGFQEGRHLERVTAWRKSP